VLDDDEVQRALVIVAHPDDVDFGAAGTVATWTAAGIEVAYCIVTDGDAGGFDPNVPRDEIPGIRRAEQTAAAKVVGVSDLGFLGYPDGRLMATLELRRDIAREIGHPGAVRAVGNACAKNPVPLIVPCHRVVRTDGGLGGYSLRGGTALKRRLLEGEGVDLTSLRAS